LGFKPCVENERDTQMTKEHADYFKFCLDMIMLFVVFSLGMWCGRKN